jgi:hypothetical protein
MENRRKMWNLGKFAFFVWIFVLIMPSIGGAASGKRVYADVLRVEVQKTGAEVYSFSATVSSPDTGWKKYANAFRIRTEKGRVLGTRVLFHPHVNEQPFTRSLAGVKIPPDVREVIVDVKDSVAGWGGKSVRVKLPR